ncbi:lambda-exonuclease family protein [Actinoallomurus sp. NPDC052274]|uniref:YqaJ viral recombinase family nuclease n=1 Tax=Actinoallomurus sp. NPDC052274 TaxID=3155420 RepID=UPI00343510F5
MGRLVTPTARLLLPANAGREEWEAARQGGLGGSDIAAVLGMDKYRSPRHVWLDKRGELPDLPRDPELDEAAESGTELEDYIARKFARKTGTRVRRVGTLVHVDHPWMRVNIDRRVYGCPDGPCLLECKNRSEWQRQQWSEEVPDGPALQAHWGLAVTGYGHAHVAVLLGGNSHRHFRIERDEELLSHLISYAGEFWQSVTDPAAPPPPIDGSDAATELLARMWNATKDAKVRVDPDVVRPLIDRKDELVAQMEELAVEVARIENQLKEMLGEAEIGVDAADNELVSWKQNGNFAPKRFAKEHPELAAKYTRLAEVFDLKTFKAEQPEMYRAYRARVLRTPTKGTS